MDSRSWFAARVSAVVTLIAAVLLVVAPASASASVVLSSPSPAPGTTTNYGNGTVSIHASATADILLPQSLTVDGLSLLSLSASYLETGGHWENDGCDEWWVPDAWDYRYATFSGYAPRLTDGAHVATAIITDSGGESATETWPFNVAQTPTISSVSPSVNSTNTTPIVRVVFSDNPGTHTCTLTVGGKAVPTVQVGNEFQAQIVDPLTPGTSYNCTATVTDQGGRSTTYNWTFQAFSVDTMVGTMLPATGSTSSYYPTVSLTVSSSVAITSMSFSTDGGTPSYSSVQKVNATTYRANNYPGYLIDGSHTTTATVYIAGGGSRTFSTTYFVNQPPSIGSVSPGADTRTTQTTPTISASFADNGPSNRTATMTVDGVPVTPTLTASAITYKPSTPLAQEQTHTVSVRLVDAAGNAATKTWSFWIDRYAAMPTGNCSSCHPTYPATHETRSCDLACHQSAGHGDDNCDSCHGGHAFTPCSSCHNGIATGSHETATGTPHNSTTSFDDCRRCHSPSLTREHARHKTDAGASLDCITCHGAAASTAVKTAIATSDTRCEACHPSADHQAVHVSPTTASCFGSGCHPASKNLVDVHAPYAGPGSPHPEFANECDLCHDNPAVDTATAGTACTPACHSGSTHSEYATKHAPTSASNKCTACHSGELSTVHGASPSDGTGCASCHAQQDNWTETADCASCHPMDGHESVHPSSLPTTCAECHTGNLVTEHIEKLGLGCAVCHEAGQAQGLSVSAAKTTAENLTLMPAAFSSVDASVQAAIAAGDTSCGACHDVAAGHYALHDGALAAAPDCAVCHTQDNISLQHADNCDACHESSSAVVQDAITAGSVGCIACHPPHGVPNRSSAYLGTDTSEAMRDISAGGSKAAYVTWAKAQADMVSAGEVATSTPHANYTTTTIKCQVCHSVHKAAESGSKLLMNAGGGCVVCHGATSAVGSSIKVSADGSASDQGGFANEDQRHGKAGSCIDYECHASSPHGVGVSQYAVAKSAMLSDAVDPLIAAALVSGASNAVETAVINDDWTESMHIDEARVDIFQPALDGADALAVTAPADAAAKARGRAIVTGYTCANNGCHINGSFNGLSEDAQFGAYRVVVDGVELVNGSTETTLGVDGLRDKSIKGHTLFTAASTATSTAFAPSGECKACHDSTDVRRGMAKSFPHSNAVWAVADAAGTGNNVSGSFTGYGYVRLYSDSAWFKIAGSVNDTAVPTNSRQVTATTPTSGQAYTVGMDGACLKCHREGSAGAYTGGVGVDY